ncbi:hypothetical protein K432DRAFT_320615 [Lepidopterella palustris CBS 459.81]|uniref:LYR motif-containing protein Cup1-like N-terminal domain-containing protein n=1 Tax=Lepidopterella palustris CBS 459.81 TaxID=1314670 RepID=A0A8E2EHX0_9PEZI|nr:hypothetical protein K432DRAFT_320615 [Lepidopterella palustris CBS 459.81]
MPRSAARLVSADIQRRSALRLFRALLRESTYLPDQTARLYYRQLIISRFRAYQIPTTVERPWWELNGKCVKRLKPSTIEKRASEKRRQGRQVLSFLHRASNGNLRCLQKVLLHAYGRAGRRRYDLLKQLSKPEVLESSSVVEDILNGSRSMRQPLQKLYHSDKQFLAYFDHPQEKAGSQIQLEISNLYPKLRALLKSQETIRPPGNLRKPLRSSKLIAPSTNIWARPMPVKRARNIVKRWYKNTMEKVQPPLPDHEWEHLKQLATGQVKWEGLVTRRPRGITEPWEVVDDQKMIWRKTLTKTLIEGLTPRARVTGHNSGGAERPHNLTARFMRRLYAHIWAHACKVTFDTTRNKWSVDWGTTRKQNLGSLPASVEDRFFSGVDEKGRLLKDDSGLK